MQISNIVGIGSGFLMLGMAGVLLVGILFGIGYGLIYRKLLHGQRRLKRREIWLGAVCLCYLIVVVGATLMSRGSGYREVCLYPFYSYRLAWHSWSSIEWRNLILNICLFVPWGFLLPLWGGRFRKFTWTVGSGLLGTLLIEGIQFVFERGVVEFDDIFNNTLGTLIGYGLVMALLELFSREGRKVRRILLGILPLLLTLGAYGSIRIAYEMQPYGNLSVEPNYRVNMRGVEINGKTKWSREEAVVTMYQTTVADDEETLERAQEILGAYGASVDEDRTCAYDDTVIYYSTDGNYHVWVDYKGLSYSLTDFSVYEEEREEVLHASEEEVRGVLEKLDIEVPEEAVFEETGNGNYMFEVPFLQIADDEVAEGSLSLQLYEGNLAADINNRIIHYTACGEEEIISEEEAYQKLTAGEFWYPFQTEQIQTMWINSVELGYAVDTKGFYQPVYEFSCQVNDADESCITIPALQ